MNITPTIGNIKSEIDKKVNAAEITEALSLKANSNDVYNKNQLDNALSDKLSVNGGEINGNISSNHILRTGFKISNIANSISQLWENYVLVIKTKVPYVSQVFPSFRIYGYNYGEAKSIDLRLSFYPYDETFIARNLSTTTNFKPQVYLSTYFENGQEYISIILKENSYYFCIVSVDVYDYNINSYTNSGTIEWYTSFYNDNIPKNRLLELSYSGAIVSRDVLSLEEIEASTDLDGKVASAKAVKDTKASFGNYASLDIPMISYHQFADIVSEEDYFHKWITYVWQNYKTKMASKMVLAPVNPNVQGIVIGWCYWDENPTDASHPRYCSFEYINGIRETRRAFGYNDGQWFFIER